MILHFSYKDHVTNEEVRAEIQQTTGPNEDLLTIVKRCKLQWYGYVSRSSGPAKNHLARHNERGKKTRQTEEEVGRQHQGKDRPGARQVPEGSGEQRKMEETFCEIICGAPTTLAIKGLMMMMSLGCSKTKQLTVIGMIALAVPKGAAYSYWSDSIGCSKRKQLLVISMTAMVASKGGSLQLSVV